LNRQERGNVAKAVKYATQIFSFFWVAKQPFPLFSQSQCLLKFHIHIERLQQAAHQPVEDQASGCRLGSAAESSASFIMNSLFPSTGRACARQKTIRYEINVKILCNRLSRISLRAPVHKGIRAVNINHCPALKLSKPNPPTALNMLIFSKTMTG